MQDQLAQYKSFYQQTFPMVLGHLRRLGVRSEEDLEDIVQETYAEALKSWSSLKDRQAAPAWVLTIARRQLARYIQKKTGREWLSLDENRDVEDAEEHTLEEKVDRHLLCEAVIDKIRQVNPPEKRNAIRQFYLEGSSLKEIAQSSGKKVSTLTTWLGRFRETIKSEFAERQTTEETKVNNLKNMDFKTLLTSKDKRIKKVMT